MKVGMKARVRGRDFIEFIDRHPGRDVWFLNALGIEPVTSRNVWLQGEHHHPGILGLITRVFRHVGIDSDPASLDQPQSQVLYCNYWAGTRRFWNAYMAGRRGSPTTKAAVVWLAEGGALNHPPGEPTGALVATV